MTTLHIALLGPLTVTVDNRPAAFRTDAERALLAYLAAQQGIPQRRDTLAALLSPDRPDSDALTYLRNRLTRLRDTLQDDQAVPPWLAVDRKQLTLRAGDDIRIDVTQFEQRLATVETHPHRQLAGCPTCLAQLDEAVALIRGEFLAGLNFPSDTWEAWLLTQREHVQQRALDAMTLLRDARLERGEWAAVLALAQHQLSLEPWLEAAHRALMQAHAQLGDRNAALAHYEQCEHLLWEELGVAPEEETTVLWEKIKAAEIIQLPATRHPPSPLPDNLPLQTGRFFGREAEQTHLIQRLADKTTRLITLVGTGGVGKTRLALEVGQAIKASFPDGVWFVALDAVKGGPEQIKIAIGEAAGLGEADKQLTGDQVLAILRDKQLLLILDNCEMVLDELSFVPHWLNRAPGVVMLATSREALNFTAEAVLLLAGLPMGDGARRGGEIHAAEALFTERGQLARSDFAVTAENLPQVRRICQLVDGLPLGIALAAAWARRRSLAQISDAIEGSLDFLSTQLRDIDPRHRSIHAVFESSWQLLTAGEQAVLAALSVFPASFSAEAAATVASATRIDLDLLCEKSLLQQQHEAERFSLHSLVRQFATEKLGPRSSVVEWTFVNYFYQLAQTHQTQYAKLQPEWGNLTAAVAKAHAHKQWQMVLDLVSVLDEGWFRQMRLGEMQAGLGLALDATLALQNVPTRAKILLRLGEVETEQNQYIAAEAHLYDALEKFMQLEEGRGIGQAKYLLGRIKNEQALDDEALALLTDSRRIFEEENEPLGVAKTLNLMAVCHAKQYRDFATAHSYLEQSAALQRKLPLSSSYIETLRNLARVKSRTGAHAAAEQCLMEATEVSRQLDDIGEYGAVLYEHATLCKLNGQIDAALALGQESLETFGRLGNLRWEALIKTQLGLLYQAKEQFQEGLALLNQGLQIFHELGDRYEQAYSYYYLSELYTDMGEIEQSLQAKARAQHLNLELNDPQLSQRLH